VQDNGWQEKVEEVAVIECDYGLNTLVAAVMDNQSTYYSD
jgi:hypothetical protein